jgi:squalene-hopene/tetraprenyl-beta-curcumene cyclase
MTTPNSRLDAGIAAAVDGLFALRRPDGSWQGYLPSSAVSTGSALIGLRAAGADGSAGLVAGAAAWLRATQESDGGWGDAPGGPSTLNATAIAVAALRVADRTRCGASAEAVGRGLARLDGWGGPAAVGDRATCTLKAVCEHYLAEAGLYDERRIARMPVEVVLLPRWLRQKLSFTVPGLMSWGLMHLRTRPGGPVRRAVGRVAGPRALAYLTDLAAYEARCPDVPGAVEESALMASIVMFGLAKAGIGADIVNQYRDYLRATVRPDGSWPIDRDIEFSSTAYVTHGLLDAGLGARLVGTGDWVRRCQRAEAFRPTGCPPGGWGWSMPSGWPDTDDTAGGVVTLAGLGSGPDDPQVRYGLEWLLAMQNRNGSWGCFARDAGVSMDLPCSVMTAHAAIALHACGHTHTDPPLAATVRWFTRAQRADGAFTNVWFRGLTCGTARVLDALGRLGLGTGDTARRARRWLLATQCRDGGWGDGEGSPSSVEETAWAVLGLVAAGDAGAPQVRAGVNKLLDAQWPDGRWPAALVGVYFLGLTYWCDHIADGFALQALARYRAATSGPVVTVAEVSDAGI